MGRSIKLNQRFIDTANQVINEDINAVIFSDLDLLEETNDRLKEADRITDRTFRTYKAKADSETLYNFFLLIKRAKRFSRIFNDRNIVSICNLHYFFNSAWKTECMHWNNGANRMQGFIIKWFSGFSIN